MTSLFHNPFAVVLMCLTATTAIGAMRNPRDGFYAWLFRFLTGMVGVMGTIVAAKMPEAGKVLTVSTETTTDVQSGTSHQP